MKNLYCQINAMRLLNLYQLMESVWLKKFLVDGFVEELIKEYEKAIKELQKK